jgi:hypothetical protein
MRTHIAVSILAASLMAISSAAFAQKADVKVKVKSDTPPYASTTGTTARSGVAIKHGANKKGFCPPGQAKKRGDGSAFKC